MRAKELAEKLLQHPDFEVKFNSFFQEYAGGPLICDSWVNIDIVDIGHSDKIIVLGGELE